MDTISSKVSTMEKSKQRIPITDIERQRLRKHYKDHPTLTQEGLLSWFGHEFGRKMSGSSISDTLSSKYSYLDSGEARDGGRKKGPQWPELEDSLFQYWRDAQPCMVTGPNLKMKAVELWEVLKCGQNEKVPSFSDGWLTKWRTRYEIGQHSKPNSSSSRQWARSKREPLDTEQVIERPLKRLRLSSQHPNNIHTGSFGNSINIGTSHNRALGISPPHPACGIKSDGFREFRIAIEEISLLCSLKQEGSIILSDHTILKILAKLLNSAAKSPFPHPSFSNDTCLYAPRDETKTDILRAFNALKASEVFQLQVLGLDLSKASCEQWFTDFINPERIRSPSPDLIDIKDLHSRRPRNTVTNEMILQDMRQSKPFAALTLYLWARYRVDLSGQNLRITNESSGNITSEETRAQLVITPLVDAEHLHHVRFQLSTQSYQAISPLSLPKISVRNTRPKGSRIFEIAKYGNAINLGTAFFQGEGSVNDCDPDGRTLIGYALRSRNTSIIKYLVSLLRDVNAYEADETGSLRSLLAMIYWFDLAVYNKMKVRQEIITCLRLMLSVGAHPYIPMRNWERTSDSVFPAKTHWYHLEIMIAYLEEGKPFHNFNTDGKQDREPILITISDAFNIRGHFYTEMHEKVNQLLRRGADVNAHWHCSTCLHHFFDFSVIQNHIFYRYNHPIFKDILMSLVTAGADISAYNFGQGAVSEIACRNGHEEIWLETLAECGYNIEPVLATLKNYENYQDYPGIGCFPAVFPPVRPTKLCFEEYCQQRKSLNCVKCMDIYRSYSHRLETTNFVKLVAEESDSEDGEWMSSSKGPANNAERVFCSENKDEDRNLRCDEYSWENKTIIDIKSEYCGGVDYRFVW